MIEGLPGRKLRKPFRETLQVKSINIDGKPGRKSGIGGIGLLFALGLPLLFFLMVFSMGRGSTGIAPAVIINAIFHFNPEITDHLIVVDLRIPRVLASALVGAALAVSGAVMQGITRNEMADSGIMGLTAGAGLGLSVRYAFFPHLPYVGTIFLCFLGAASASAMVHGVSRIGHRDPSPMRLVLAGSVVSAMLTAMSQGMALLFDTSQDIMFWQVGGVSAVSWDQIRILLPFVLIPLFLLGLISQKISILSLGEETARGLGINVKEVFLLSSLFVVVLAGVSVSVVGAVGFVGLMVPHIASFFVGPDHRKLIPSSALLGAILMVAADLGSKTLNPPYETPVGAVIAMIGVPFFLYLANRQRRS